MATALKTRTIEGVPYYRFLIRYTLVDGRRRRMIRWSPGFPWVRTEVARELDALFGIDAIKPGSVTICHADLVNTAGADLFVVPLKLPRKRRSARAR